MPRRKYLINLNEEERQTLETLTSKDKAKARQFKRAMILYFPPFNRQRVKGDTDIWPRIQLVINNPRLNAA